MFGKKDKKDLEVYSLYDSATGQYNLPSFYMTELEARRSAERMLNDPRQKDSLLVTNAQDYSLFHVGYYDRATGKLETLSAPRHVLSMHELKAQMAITNQPSGNPQLIDVSQ